MGADEGSPLLHASPQGRPGVGQSSPSLVAPGWRVLSSRGQRASPSPSPSKPGRQHMTLVPSPLRLWVLLSATSIVSVLFGALLTLTLIESYRELGAFSEASFSPSWPLVRRLTWAARRWRKVAGLQRGTPVKGDAGTALWPMPTSSTHGKAAMMVSPQLEFLSADWSPLPEVVAQAVTRYRQLIFEGRNPPSRAPGFDESQILMALLIRVSSFNSTLHVGVNESYALHVPHQDSPGALLEAETVYGVLRGLETFSQLCQYDFDQHAYVIKQVPWVINDAPRFVHRGLLVDTSRHYQAPVILEHIVDSMAWAKLNVLHWHMVDQQAFPIEVPSFRRLWNGAHSQSERYSLADVARIVRYAAARGVVVMPEIDVPGHAASWGVGYPQLWPRDDCRMPLDVSKNFTFDVIRGILRDLKSVVPYPVFHFGGDEVDWVCWQITPQVAEWMHKQGLEPKSAYEYFVLRAVEIAKEEGWGTVVLWEETFNNFGESLQDSVVIENWLDRSVRDRVVAAGRPVLMSLVGEWYLDHEEHGWWSSYSMEPCSRLQEGQCRLVLGGETCMWTEHVDASNILTRIWPRAAAVAERLWSPLKHTSSASMDKTRKRLSSFRCLLHRRGIPANYLNGTGWSTVFEPGSCYET